VRETSAAELHALILAGIKRLLFVWQEKRAQQQMAGVA
jgi:hypothetical protein